MFGTKIYTSWSAMLYRCRNPKAKAYANYGGRGITVCERWHTFENFYLDMGDTHWDGAELDRKDVNGNYEPDNCRWVTTAENLRNCRDHRVVVYRGQEWNVPNLCLHLGLPRTTIQGRLRIGWSLEKALMTPVRQPELKTLRIGDAVLTYKQASKEFGVSINTLRGRLYRGWSVEEALNIEQRKETL